MPLPILVIGSSNTDMVVRSDRLPARGETVVGGTFLMNAGGKGANQAVAAARLGGQVTFVAKVGNDVFGKQALKQLAGENIDTRFVYTDGEHPSGVALIGVDGNGENIIIVAPGSNQFLKGAEVSAALNAIQGQAIVLLQMEIPLVTVCHAIRESAERGMKIILNPAPAQSISPDLFGKLFLITPNESEAALITGIDITDDHAVVAAASKIHDLGIPNVIITLGKRGVYVSGGVEKKFIPSPPVRAVDTTAAGDCFNGAVAVALARGSVLTEAAAFGCAAASLSVTRVGARISMPYLHEVEYKQKIR